MIILHVAPTANDILRQVFQIIWVFPQNRKKVIILKESYLQLQTLPNI